MLSASLVDLVVDSMPSAPSRPILPTRSFEGQCGQVGMQSRCVWTSRRFLRAEHAADRHTWGTFNWDLPLMRNYCCQRIFWIAFAYSSWHSCWRVERRGQEERWTPRNPAVIFLSLLPRLITGAGLFLLAYGPTHSVSLARGSRGCSPRRTSRSSDQV